jgi:hypothetical protein
MPMNAKPLAFLLLPLAFLAACGDRKTEYPQEVRANFIGACMAQAPSEQMCGCILGKVEKKWTLDAYTKLESTLSEAPGSAESLAAVETFKGMAAECAEGR